MNNFPNFTVDSRIYKKIMEKAKRKPAVKVVEKAVVAPDIGKLPPQARELEEAVLGALMLEKDAYSIVSEILKPESFYDPTHQLVYGAIQGLAMQQKPVDVLTVVEELKRQGELDAAGGAVYVAELSEKVASAAHIEYHARIIAQKYLARELISFSSEVSQHAFDETVDVDDLMQETEGRLFEISQRNVKKDVIQINPVIKEAMNNIQLAANRQDLKNWTNLHRAGRIPILSSLQPAQLWVKLRLFFPWLRISLSISNSLLPSFRLKCRMCNW